jgi:sRNA-binding regulator protein Hfq
MCFDCASALNGFVILPAEMVFKHAVETLYSFVQVPLSASHS